jgi:hypothetical protein
MATNGRGDGPGADPRLIAFVAAAVVVGWLASFAIGAVQQNWTPLTITTPVMLILAGYAFGIRLTRNGNGGNRE